MKNYTKIDICIFRLKLHHGLAVNITWEWRLIALRGLKYYLVPITSVNMTITIGIGRCSIYPKTV